MPPTNDDINDADDEFVGEEVPPANPDVGQPKRSKQSRKSVKKGKKQPREESEEAGSQEKKSTTITKSWPNPNDVNADTAAKHVYNFLRELRKT